MDTEFDRRVQLHAVALATLRDENPRRFRTALRRVEHGWPALDIAVVVVCSFAPGAAIHFLLEAQLLPQPIVFGCIGLAWRIAFLFVWWWLARPAVTTFSIVSVVVLGSTLWANFVAWRAV